MEEGRRHGIHRVKMISECCQHCDKSISSKCQRKDVEFVKDVCSIRDGRKQPVEVVLINTLREEGNDLKKPLGIRAKFLEHWGGKQEFNCGGKALVMLCLQYTCSPFSDQLISIPLVVMCNSSKQGN